MSLNGFALENKYFINLVAAMPHLQELLITAAVNDDVWPYLGALRFLRTLELTMLKAATSAILGFIDVLDKRRNQGMRLNLRVVEPLLPDDRKTISKRLEELVDGRFCMY